MTDGMDVQATILAAGMGTRLGRPFPKPLTPLAGGRTIMQQQMDNLRAQLGEDLRITVVVGFKMDLVMEAHPDVLFAYNEEYDRTNTSKSLLKALRTSAPGGVLWLNGDVVFDPRILEKISPLMADDTSFVCVNTAVVGEEEVKYTVDSQGNVAQLSKVVEGGLGEAVGINFVSSGDKRLLIERLRECGDQDYFERGIELAIEKDGMKVQPVDISEYAAVEIDFEDDLARANSVF